MRITESKYAFHNHEWRRWNDLHLAGTSVSRETIDRLCNPVPGPELLNVQRQKIVVQRCRVIEIERISICRANVTLIFVVRVLIENGYTFVRKLGAKSFHNSGFACSTTACNPNHKRNGGKTRRVGGKWCRSARRGRSFMRIPNRCG